MRSETRTTHCLPRTRHPTHSTETPPLWHRQRGPFLMLSCLRTCCCCVALRCVAWLEAFSCLCLYQFLLTSTRRRKLGARRGERRASLINDARGQWLRCFASRTQGARAWVCHRVQCQIFWAQVVPDRTQPAHAHAYVHSKTHHATANSLAMPFFCSSQACASLSYP